MDLKLLPPDARPREKLLARGAASLADAELLALLLRTGLRGEGVVALAARVLAEGGGFAGLLTGPSGRLASIRGLGPAKRAELLAVMEIARRALAAPLAQRPVLDQPQQMREYFALHLAGRPREVFSVMFLDVRLQMLATEDLFEGTLTQTSVYPREVVRRALELGAAAVVLAHNHPSGAAEPSRADEWLTRSLVQALALVEVRVLDHIVVGRGEVMSFAERGLL
jgi:DNA repair protein RadC